VTQVQEDLLARQALRGLLESKVNQALRDRKGPLGKTVQKAYKVLKA
jgi:hypothetical protein